MKSKIALLAFLLFALPSLAQAQCIASGGLINCFIPGATITGTGASQVVALPGGITTQAALTVNGLLTINNSGGSNQFLKSPTTGAAVNYAAAVNTSGGIYWGVENSTGSGLGNTAYASFVQSGTNTELDFGINGAAKWKIGASNTSNAFQPFVDNAYDLCSPTLRCAHAYTVVSSVNTTGTSASLNTGGNVRMTALATSTALSTTYLCVDSSGLLINDAAACIISAAKFKENVTGLDSKDALALVLAMHPVNYDLKDHALDGWKNQFGFIADDAAKLRPELATYDAEGNVHGFRYEQYTAYLTGAVQELNARIEALEKR